jgi:putative ATPase
MSDLFSDAAEARLPAVAPLALRLRPKRLEDFVGQRQMVGPGSALALSIAEDRVASSILYGPPGSGCDRSSVRGAVGGVRVRRGRSRGHRPGP